MNLAHNERIVESGSKPSSTSALVQKRQSLFYVRNEIIDSDPHLGYSCHSTTDSN